jgi:hypothetical protein
MCVRLWSNIRKAKRPYLEVLGVQIMGIVMFVEKIVE